MLVSKGQLNMAFKLMREKNLIARQNFLCCGSCAGSAITTLAEQRIEKGKQIDGCCFYHGQANDDYENGNDFYIQYGNMDSNKIGEIGKPTKEVGDIVVECLKAARIGFEWDGSPDTAILILNKEVW